MIKIIICLIFTISIFGEDLYDDSSPQVSSSSSHIFSGSIDFRLVSTDKDTGWRDRGRGLSRYGAHRTDDQSKEFTVPQVILVYDGIFDGLPAVHLQLNYSDHEDRTHSTEKIGIVEAYISDEVFTLFNARLGYLFPEISLEHTEVGWNTKYTITPSGINSWIGEELRPLALELSLKKNNWSFQLAGFSGNDPFGAIISYRGFAFHDYQAVIGSRLHMQPTDVQGSTWTAPFREIDGRVGVYSKVGFSRPKFKAEVFYYNNLANSTIQKGNDYAWETEFIHFATKASVTADFEILAQGMFGNTKMGSGPTVDNDYYSYFVMPTYKWDKNLIALRYDVFDVKDRDNNQTGDNNNAKGSALTFAYTYLLSDNKSLAFEYMTIDSERPGNPLADQDFSDPKDNLLQINYRLKF